MYKSFKSLMKFPDIFSISKLTISSKFSGICSISLFAIHKFLMLKGRFSKADILFSEIQKVCSFFSEQKNEGIFSI